MPVRRLTTARRRVLRAASASALVVGALLAPVVSAPPASAASAASADVVRDREYWLDEYGIRTAWATTRGASATIAIIDSGVADTVAELRDAVVGGADFSGQGSADGTTAVGDADTRAHGTMVASLAAGRGSGASSGVLGVAPEAAILTLSVGFGQASTDSDAEVADAVRWATDHGADVINMSLTRNTLDWPESWDDAFLYAMEHDVVIVAAAGNRAGGTEEVGAPATMPGVLTVSGIDRAGEASVDASTQGITIGVAAPSEALVGVGPDGTYYEWSGTSGATPIVSGVVALVRAAHPELDAANVIQRVIATAHDAGAVGPDPLYGYGLIDAADAVRGQVATVAANPVGDLAEWIRLNRRAAAGGAGEIVISPPSEVAEPPAESAIEGVADPTGTLLPSAADLRLVGLPTLVVLTILTTIGGLIVGLLRTFKRPRT